MLHCYSMQYLLELIYNLRREMEEIMKTVKKQKEESQMMRRKIIELTKAVTIPVFYYFLFLFISFYLINRTSLYCAATYVHGCFFFPFRLSICSNSTI